MRVAKELGADGPVEQAVDEEGAFEALASPAGQHQMDVLEDQGDAARKVLAGPFGEPEVDLAEDGPDFAFEDGAGLGQSPLGQGPDPLGNAFALARLGQDAEALRQAVV